MEGKTKKQGNVEAKRALPASKQAVLHLLERSQAAILPQRRRNRSRSRIANTVVAQT